MGTVVQSQDSSAFLSFKVCGSTDIPKGSKVKLVSLMAFSAVSTWLATFIRSEPPSYHTLCLCPSLTSPMIHHAATRWCHRAAQTLHSDKCWAEPSEQWDLESKTAPAFLGLCRAHTSPPRGG